MNESTSDTNRQPARRKKKENKEMTKQYARTASQYTVLTTTAVTERILRVITAGKKGTEQTQLHKCKLKNCQNGGFTNRQPIRYDSYHMSEI